ncbi:hypothetical protein ACTA71_008654 [Dictyostelium dimigraforme]
MSWNDHFITSRGGVDHAGQVVQAIDLYQQGREFESGCQLKHSAVLAQFQVSKCYNPNSKYPPVLQPKIPSSALPSVAIQFPSFPSNLRLIGQVCSRKSSGRKRNVLYKLI